MKNKLLLTAAVAATIAIAASLLGHGHFSQLSPSGQIVPLAAIVPTLLRWLAIALIAAYATSRRSLTAWILVGLLAGAELGHDAPSFAVKLQLLGTIFLRLIRVIIAPLLFAVLVVGIAGHADLKKVGRLGIKSLVYFEVVSTIAMLIGLAAINLSRAGEGVRLPASTTSEPLNLSPHSASQLITDIFPENIAKSVAEGQVLQIVVFSILFVLIPILLLAGIPLKAFFRAAIEPVTLGFATASSEATLPIAMEKLEAFGVPRQIVAFVLPTGYSFNMDGASLYQSLGLIFVAQAAGIHLSFGQQAIMVLTLLLSSKGTAGVARASFLIVFAAATSFHLPMEPLFLLFAIDQLMDMGRTAVTVLGNCVACVVIARWEGEFPPARPAPG